MIKGKIAAAEASGVPRGQKKREFPIAAWSVKNLVPVVARPRGAFQGWHYLGPRTRRQIWQGPKAPRIS
ncbi:MAG: hypothetical protein U1E93_12725 [Alphaproteobacteria bacterium]